jgi:hypothetical protein
MRAPRRAMTVGNLGIGLKLMLRAFNPVNRDSSCTQVE